MTLGLMRILDIKYFIIPNRFDASHIEILFQYKKRLHDTGHVKKIYPRHDDVNNCLFILGNVFSKLGYYIVITTEENYFSKYSLLFL